MLRYLLPRILLFPCLLLLVHFLTFTYVAVNAQAIQAGNPYGVAPGEAVDIGQAYPVFLSKTLRLDFGSMPSGVNEPVAAAVGRAALNSAGLALLAYAASLAAGLSLGLGAVRMDPPGLRPWLAAITTTGLAAPAFYIGSLLVAWMAAWKGAPPLPVGGLGWDEHLILPALALALRPALQVALVSGHQLSDELRQQYVTAARSFGHTWQAIRWDKALRNILAPTLTAAASAFRGMLGDLLLVEWLFNWPGLGRLLVQTLVPPRVASIFGMEDASIYFMHPALLPAVLVVFAALILISDGLSGFLASSVDPRLRLAENPEGGE